MSRNAFCLARISPRVWLIRETNCSSIRSNFLAARSFEHALRRNRSNFPTAESFIYEKAVSGSPCGGSPKDPRTPERKSEVSRSARLTDREVRGVGAARPASSRCRRERRCSWSSHHRTIDRYRCTSQGRRCEDGAWPLGNANRIYAELARSDRAARALASER